MAEAGWRDLLAAGRLPVFVILCFGVWLNAADTLVTATVMPSVARDVGGYAYFAWGAAGFLLGAIVAAASAGRMSERFGLRLSLAVSAGVYGAGCVVSALAPAIGVFLAGRLVQGFGAGWIVGLCYVAVRAHFPESLWTKVFAAIAGVWGVATVLGPLLGGLCAGAGLWRLAFWLFAAQAGVFGLAAPLVMAPSDKVQAGPGLAWRQLAILTLGVLLIALGGVLGRAAIAAALAAAGLALLGVMLWVDRGARTRLLPREASDLKTPAGAGLAMIFCLCASAIGFSVYGPALLQATRGLTPLQGGYVVATESIGWTLMAFLVSRLPRRREGLAIRGGTALAACGLAALAVVMPRARVAAVVGAGLAMGAGFGMFWAFATHRVLAALPEDELAIGSAALPTTQLIGNVAGATLAGVLGDLLGLGAGFGRASAAHAAGWLYAAFVPLALAGCAAAWRLGGLPVPIEAGDAAGDRG